MHGERLIFNTTKNGAVVGTASSYNVSDISKVLPFIVSTAFPMDRCMCGKYLIEENSLIATESVTLILNSSTLGTCCGCEKI